MLRALFGEPKRQDTGVLLEANRAIEAYRRTLQGLIEQDTPECGRYTRSDLWARGFMTALNELEQSLYAARKLREGVTQTYEEAMNGEEEDRYHSHLYFYKNAFIRVFSILDKLGYFLNDLFRLETEKVKPKFSYFTVLRQMHSRHAEPDLNRRLFELKELNKEALGRLRQKRNMEIHHINAEMLDDLIRTDLCRADRTYVEDLDANMDDLAQCFRMVAQSLTAVFEYAHGRHKV